MNLASAGPALMNGAPPFPPGQLVTLANWQDPPFNRWAFQHLRELVPTARIDRARAPRALARDERDVDGVRFAAGGRQWSLGEWVEETWTDGLLVLHDGRIVAERYLNGLVPNGAMLDAKSLPAVKMPNRKMFVGDPRPDVKNPACMDHC